MRFSFRLPAGGDARFASGAFDGSIGKTIHVGLPDDHGTGVLVAAEVVDGGRTAVLTVECEGKARARLRALTEESWQGDYSFDFTPREGITMTPVPVKALDGFLRCGQCGAKVTRISQGRQVQEDGTLGPPEPAKFGCGHLAGQFGRLVEMDLTANAPGPEAYWPELPDGLVAIAGKYDRQPRSEVTYRIEPIDGGEDRS